MLLASLSDSARHDHNAFHATDPTLMNSIVRSKWQTLWDASVNNKLHAIQPSLGCWPGRRRYARREEVVLARIRLGYTYLTHSYLLNREDQPEYVGCACPLTMLTGQHIMMDCDEFLLYTKPFFRCKKHERSIRFSYTFNNPTVR